MTDLRAEPETDVGANHAAASPPLQQQQQQQRQVEESRLKARHTDRVTHGMSPQAYHDFHKQLPHLDNAEAIKYSLLNEPFLARAFGVSVEDIGADYDVMADLYVQHRYGIPHLDPKALYLKIGEEFDLNDQLLAIAATNGALKESLEAGFRQAKAVLQKHPGWSPANEEEYRRDYKHFHKLTLQRSAEAFPKQLLRRQQNGASILVPAGSWRIADIPSVLEMDEFQKEPLEQRERILDEVIGMALDEEMAGNENLDEATTKALHQTGKAARAALKKTDHLGHKAVRFVGETVDVVKDTIKDTVTLGAVSAINNIPGAALLPPVRKVNDTFAGGFSRGLTLYKEAGKSFVANLGEPGQAWTSK